MIRACHLMRLLADPDTEAPIRRRFTIWSSRTDAATPCGRYGGIWYMIGRYRGLAGVYLVLNSPAWRGRAYRLRLAWLWGTPAPTS